MRTVLLLAVVLAGGALVTFGVSLNNVWIGAPGVALVLLAAIGWVIPAKRTPVKRSGRLTRGSGNRPTHDPTDFVGWD
jgi:hypothetical protein